MRRLLLLALLLLLTAAPPASAAFGFRFERRLPVDANGFAPAIGPGGVLWSATGDGRSLQKRDARGRLLLARPSPYPTDLADLAVGPDGSVYVAGLDEPMRKLTAAGRPVPGWRARGAGLPTEITVDGRGRVVVISEDALQPVVLRLRPDGRLDRKLLGAVGRLSAVEVAAAGSGRVAVLLEDGQTRDRFLLVLGADGRPTTPKPVPLRAADNSQVLMVRDRVVLLGRRADGRGVLSVHADDGRRLGGPSTGRATAINEHAALAAGAGGRIVLADATQVKVLRLTGP